MVLLCGFNYDFAAIKLTGELSNAMISMNWKWPERTLFSCFKCGKWINGEKQNM